MRSIVSTQVTATDGNRLPKNYAKIKTLSKREPKTLAARDWPAYEAEQRRRWDIELFITPELLTQAGWLNDKRTGRPGRPVQYSDAGVIACLQLGALFRLSLRGAEHFTRFLIRFGGADGNVTTPDHVTLHRARRRVPVDLVKPGVAPPRTIILDGTGLRAFGAGEWQRHKWGVSPVNTGDEGDDRDESGWVRLTVAVDYDSGQILDFTLQPPSGAGTGELSQAPLLLGGLRPEWRASVTEVLGDGLYDAKLIYDEAERLGARLVTPPRSTAVYGLHPVRDEALKTWSWHGEAEWKRRADYGRRSLVESTIGRIKALTGERLRCRGIAAQRAEVAYRLAALNAVTNPATQTRSSTRAKPASGAFLSPD
jgi:hypothetical protein